MLNIMDGNIRCKCGATHDGRLNIQKDLPLIDALKGLLEHGRVLIIASKEVDKGYLDTMHDDLGCEYEVTRFCGIDDVEDIEGINIIVAVGDRYVINRAKILANSYDTRLVVIPTDFNYGEYSSSFSTVDYGGKAITRPTRAPDTILVVTRVITSLSKSRWADIIGDTYSKAISFFDYTYKAMIKGDGCEYLIDYALDLLEDGLQSFDRNSDNVDRIIDIAIALSSLYKATGYSVGGEMQVYDTMMRFAKNSERHGLRGGEVAFLSSVVVGRLYKKFLAKPTPFSAWDVFSDMDKARRLLGLDELEVVGIAKKLNYEVSDYRDYKLEVRRPELYASALRCDDILTRAHYKLIRLYPDGGYHLRYYLTGEEILKVVECAPFFSRKDTLLTFIKGSGLLSITG